MTRECQQIHDLIDSYLGGELLVETNHAVLRHLESCAGCAGEVARRQEARRLLKEALAIDVDDAAVRTRVEAALDRERRWFRKARVWASSAAALVAALVIGWFVLSGPSLQAAYRDAVVDHIECALTLPATVQYDPARIRRRLPEAFTGLPGAIGESRAGYWLIDGHLCPYNGRNYTHLVLRANGRSVSLFVDPTAGAPLPRAAETTMIQPSALTVHEARYQNYEAAAVATRAHQLFVVSALPREENLRVAGDVLPPAVAFVRSLER